MIELRPTREEDLSALSDLWQACFGYPASGAEWRWKYRLLPGEGRSLVAVDGGGRVLAHAGALRLPACWQGGQGGIWQLVDFAGAAGGGRNGLGGGRGGLRPPLVALGRRLLTDLPGADDAPWIFGFPSDRHFRLGERVFGYHPLATLEPLAGALPAGPPPAAARIESGDSCGGWAEAVWESCGVFGVRRTAAFLNWRYCARPVRYYRFYRLFSAAGPAEGLAVFAFVNQEAWATELWLPPPGEWYPSMLAVAADLRAAGFQSWRFWPPPRDSSHLLAVLGLRPSGERRFLGCRRRAGVVNPAAAAAGFYYAMGDYDLA
ncbi:MAG TPA: hypothetical protein VHR45_04010 [Thermoanaerobaculia bacterium]|nr:hypothetical protein [Thermoanaerobaculia bacterium]